METLSANVQTFERYHRSFSILMIDVDHFKEVNDSHGHQAGDEVLAELAKCISSNIRSIDIVGRYGGEEFVVVLPETPEEAATELAERIRLAVENLLLPFDITITCSVGVSGIEKGISGDGLISRADHALYSAKRAGRNQVVVFGLSKTS